MHGDVVNGLSAGQSNGIAAVWVPMPFNRFRFRRYARELSKAVAEMGATSDIHTRLGIDNVRVRFGNNRQFVTMTNPDGTETTAELDMSASDADVAHALNIQKINNVTKPSETQMSITGLQEGAFQGKLAEMRKRIAASQDGALAKIDGIVSDGVAKIEEAAEGAAAKAQKEIDNALQEFAPTTNGGPA